MQLARVSGLKGDYWRSMERLTGMQLARVSGLKDTGIIPVTGTGLRRKRL